ncbi:MAG TPA: addiction module protein [Marmoricola sp.]|nr:addiction module protein [Marmoricola sp.]
MTLSASEFYEAGLALPPSVRKDLALRLLESVEVVDQETIDQAWTDEVSTRADDILSGKVETIPGEHVFTELAERRVARQDARHA